MTAVMDWLNSLVDASWMVYTLFAVVIVAVVIAAVIAEIVNLYR